MPQKVITSASTYFSDEDISQGEVTVNDERISWCTMDEDHHSNISGGEELGLEGTDPGTVADQDYDDEEDVLEKPRILLMGPRRGGKTSIQRVVFDKMSPHETMFLEPTPHLVLREESHNIVARFEIWDFPGDYDTTEKLMRQGYECDPQQVFGAFGALVLVIDAQDDPIEDTLHRLVNTVRHAHSINPNLDVEVFIHKVDGDLYMTDEPKEDCLREVQAFISRSVSQYNLDIKITYYLTSIYDHSIFDAISKVVQKLIPQLPTLALMLNHLIENCMMEKSFLFDVVSRIYVATDVNPVHMATYELCCDMIDLAIDVSWIYGIRDEAGKESDRLAYDDHSASIIRLSNGTVLYLRQVGSYLALVCLMQAEHFNNKEGLIEYNVSCFRDTLAQVFDRPSYRKWLAQRAANEA